MTIQEVAIGKVRQLPDPLAQEVNDFIDFLLIKQDASRSQLLSWLTESSALVETGMGEYLQDLEDYEERLARGGVQWPE